VGQQKPGGSAGHFRSVVGHSGGVMGNFQGCFRALWGSRVAAWAGGCHGALRGAVGSGMVDAAWGRLGAVGLSGVGGDREAAPPR